MSCTLTALDAVPALWACTALPKVGLRKWGFDYDTVSQSVSAAGVFPPPVHGLKVMRYSNNSFESSGGGIRTPAH